MISDMRAKYKLGMLPLAMQQSNFDLEFPCITEDAKDLVYQRKLENTFFFLQKAFVSLIIFLLENYILKL